MKVRLHEIVNREVILTVVKSRAAPDDLLEFDHGIDRAHQHDVADVARVHARRKLLRRGQNGGDSLFIVLKIAQMLLTQVAIIRRDPLAIIRVFAGFQLVDEVAHKQGVRLVRAEDSLNSARGWPQAHRRARPRLRGSTIQLKAEYSLSIRAHRAFGVFSRGL